jgi:hypothetical protein
MGCNCGRGRGINPPPPASSESLTGDGPNVIRDYVISQGWQFSGNAPTQAVTFRYVNPEVPGYELWLHQGTPRLEIRQQLPQTRGTKVLAVALGNNYRQEMESRLPKAVKKPNI